MRKILLNKGDKIRTEITGFAIKLTLKQKLQFLLFGKVTGIKNNMMRITIITGRLYKMNWKDRKRK